MQMKVRFGLVLAVVVGLSGCCCPMHCGNSCWMEQMQDNYCCMVGQMQDQACCMNHAISNTWNELTSSSANQCGCDQCQDGSYSNCGNQGCDDCQPRSSSAAPRLTAPSPIRDAGPANQNWRRCKRCRSAPCRCSELDRNSGFERAPRRSAQLGAHVEPTCAAPQVQSGSAPAMPPAPPAFQPAPVPANQEPATVPPAPPAPGPTPIKKDPPPTAAVEEVPAPVDVGTDGAIETQSGEAAPVITPEGPSLEQTGYEGASTPVYHGRGGWRPYPSPASAR